MLDFTANIGLLILFINLIVFIKGFSSFGKAFKFFTYYTTLMFIIQIVVSVLNFYKKNNLYLSHVYFISQFFLLSFFYLLLIKENYQRKTIQLFLILCPVLLIIQYTLDYSLLFTFNLFEIFITSFPIIIYSAFHLYNMLNEKRDFYYINLGVLIYLFGSTFLFLAGNLIVELNANLNDIPWILNSILYIIYQLFILFEWKKSFYIKKTKNN